MRIANRYKKFWALLGGLCFVAIVVSSCGTSKGSDCHSCPNWGYYSPDSVDEVDQPRSRS
jgi:hypothetical protein